jgi:hypothetical protein
MSKSVLAKIAATAAKDLAKIDPHLGWFCARLDEPEFPAPLVAEAAGETVQMLATWRVRPEVAMHGWEKRGGRYFFTGEGLLAAGLLAVLVRQIGSPSKAAFLKAAILEQAAAVRLLFPDVSSVAVLYSDPPGNPDAENGPERSVETWQAVGYALDIVDPRVPGAVNMHRPHIVVPISTLFQDWARMAARSLEKAQAE